MGVATDAALLATKASGSRRATSTWLVTRPGAVGRTCTNADTEALGGSVPRSQVTWPAAVRHAPWLEFAEINSICGGKLSVTTTPVETDGPLLATTMV